MPAAWANYGSKLKTDVFSERNFRPDSLVEGGCLMLPPFSTRRYPVSLARTALGPRMRPTAACLTDF